MPRHKRLRLRDGQSAPTITTAVVEKVRGWCAARGLRTLYVCPYQQLPPRLRGLGFAPVADPPGNLRFGALRLREDLCEEAQMHVYEVPG